MIVVLAGTIVAVLILLWGVYEVSRRYNIGKPMQELQVVPEEDEEDSEAPEAEQQQARQNGHYSGSTKRL